MSGRNCYQVALLTGQSDPSQWVLSPAQDTFLASIGVPPDCRVRLNFPYREGSTDYRPAHLLEASLHNGALYFRSRLRAFRQKHLTDVEALIAAADRTVFLAGSCGLELFNNLRLRQSLLERVSVFAFGPVARGRPACAHLLVGGRRDPLSRWFFPRPDHLIDCGHLSYLSDPTLRTLCRGFVAETARAARETAP